MQLIKGEAREVERAQARLARRGQVPGTAIRDPVALRPRQPTLGRDDDARPIAGPRPQRRGNEALVVTDIAVVVTVGIGGIDERDAGLECRVEDRRRGGGIPIGGGREPHAAETGEGGRKDLSSCWCRWPS